MQVDGFMWHLSLHAHNLKSEMINYADNFCNDHTSFCVHVEKVFESFFDTIMNIRRLIFDRVVIQKDREVKITHM